MAEAFSLRWPRWPAKIMAREVGVCTHPDHEKPELLPLREGKEGLPVAVCPQHGPVAGCKYVYDFVWRTPRSIFSHADGDFIKRKARFGKIITVEKALSQGYTLEYLVDRGIITPNEAEKIRKYYEKLSKFHRKFDKAVESLLRVGWRIVVTELTPGEAATVWATSPEGERVMGYYTRYEQPYGEGDEEKIGFFIDLAYHVAMSDRPVYRRLRAELEEPVKKLRELIREYDKLGNEEWHLNRLLSRPCSLAREQGHVCVKAERGRRGGVVGTAQDGRFAVFKTRPAPRPGDEVVATEYTVGPDRRGKEILRVYKWIPKERYVAVYRRVIEARIRQLEREEARLEKKIDEQKDRIYEIFRRVFLAPGGVEEENAEEAATH